MRIGIWAMLLVLMASPLPACSSESVNANAAATEQLVDVTIATQKAREPSAWKSPALPKRRIAG